ncbi:17546_t:CDS:2 [Gigaspora margarita]|uniref:17546_t:CDS:1 n=1 Tax=Gigaspora margarita TaxID=4874 RepID=A0ABN7UEZ1_GIGMA|nr:17546_t:CDS:2 [Gigaspora margarita]
MHCKKKFYVSKLGYLIGGDYCVTTIEGTLVLPTSQKLVFNPEFLFVMVKLGYLKGNN